MTPRPPTRPVRYGIPTAAPTAHQLRVLGLVAEGLDNAQIATKLGLAPNTVKTHMARILIRLNSRDRAHAVATGYRFGYLPLPTTTQEKR